MTDSLNAKARMGRVVALNRLTARKTGSAPKVVKTEPHAPVMFKSVRTKTVTRPNRQEVFVERGLKRVSGYVMWFSLQQERGEFMCEDTGSMVQINTASLHKFGVQTVIEGTWLDAQCIQTSEGVRAKTILELRPPENWFVGNGYEMPRMAA